ncbi:transferase [Streptomyces sp. NPDC050485]|uniref:transferase n=1 Tax=Streptomyces sp. NPDC050485 TaxID=3365617 RepID=UPI0037A60FB5
MTTTAESPDTGSASATPRADCIADSAGGVTFDITGAGRPGATLVLRRRGANPGPDVLLPLTPAAEGRLRAVLPSTVELAEGLWDGYLRVGEEEQRLEPGTRDLRALVDREPGPDADRVAVRIPYAGRSGELIVRSWLRKPHAETGTIGFGEGAVTVQGRLYGTGLGPDAVVEARLRGGGGRVHRVPATAEGDGFTFTLPYAPLAEGLDAKEWLWDLWLVTGTAAVRLARILDDVPLKQVIFVYPGSRVGPGVVRPYYTGANDLSVRVDAAAG